MPWHPFWNHVLILGARDKIRQKHLGSSLLIPNFKKAALNYYYSMTVIAGLPVYLNQ
jgi:hypothetical protein